MLRIYDLKRPLPGLPLFFHYEKEEKLFKSCTGIQYYTWTEPRQLSNFQIEIIEEGLLEITCHGEKSRQTYTRKDIQSVTNFRLYLLELAFKIPAGIPVFMGNGRDFHYFISWIYKKKFEGGA